MTDEEAVLLLEGAAFATRPAASGNTMSASRPRTPTEPAPQIGLTRARTSILAPRLTFDNAQLCAAQMGLDLNVTSETLPQVREKAIRDLLSLFPTRTLSHYLVSLT